MGDKAVMALGPVHHSRRRIAPHAHAARVKAQRVFGTDASVTVRGGGARKRTLRERQQAAAGVLVVPRIVAGASVTRAEMQQAVAALRLLPAADLALVARNGIQIHLYPIAGLEDSLLGATTIVQNNEGGPWHPTMIRVASRANLSGSQSLGEIVQHEFGHAVSVLRSQDRSEDAAIAYARRY